MKQLDQGVGYALSRRPSLPFSSALRYAQKATMEAAFSSLVFTDPVRAESNLELLEQQLPASLWIALPTLLGQLPDPDSALNYLERYLQPGNGEGAPETRAHSLSYLRRHPTALHHLLLIFSYSRFLSESLVRQPELISWLHQPARRGAFSAQSLDRIKTAEDLHEEFARFEAVSLEQESAAILARFKRREYLRITLRDVLGLATLAETTLELSQLADVLLERALRICEQRLLNDYGSPQYTDSAGRRHAPRLTILSLGKLGGQELNYSSDIDLMFLYGRDGETSGGRRGATSNAEFFVRLAQSVLKMISEVTSEGAVFRVDLRLRPQGKEGDLATSIPAALDYYRTRAREWELQMLIKARCSAGELEGGSRFLREVRSLVYRSEFNIAAVEAVLDARQEITRDLERQADASGHAAEWNVKLSPGGIRDIEFLSQCLQRLFGGADPWLRTNSTLVALQRLHDKGHLSGRDFFRLGAAYEFLRKVEHRLQLRDGVQRHTLPRSPEALDRLARRCGIEAAPAQQRTPAQQLLQRVSQHFGEVREIYDRILTQRRSSWPALPADDDPADPGASQLLRRLHEEYPEIASTLERVAPRFGKKEEVYARRGLTRFLASAVLDPSLMAQLVSHSEWLAGAAKVFARSDLAAEMVSRHPEEIRVVADPGLGGFRGPAEETTVRNPDEAMAQLRLGYRRAVLATVVRALLASAQPFETFESLTRLADQALESTLALSARKILGDGQLEKAPFTVLALGRLGTGELDVGSDVDVMFVSDEFLSAEQREGWRQVAESFVQLASSHTRQGLLFPVDIRLRPRGGEGEIVQSAAYLRSYFRSEADAWEAATFLKARPVAANLALGGETVRQVHAVLAERFNNPSELATHLARTRQRMELAALERDAAELDRRVATKGEFKKRTGGFYDADYVLAFLFLTRGLTQGVQPGGHVLRQIAALESAGVLTTTQAQTLRSASLLYRCLDHAIRLVTGRPASRMPEPELAERAATLLTDWGIPTGEGVELVVEQTQRQVRALYEQIVLSQVWTS